MGKAKRIGMHKMPRLYTFIRDIYRNYLIIKHRDMDEEQAERELSCLYAKRMGFRPNLIQPTRYTEKMQWAKIHDHDPLRTVLSDKLQVRNWVSSKIGDQYLIPLLGSWDCADDIDFDSLPQSFVLKTNNASGTNIIVTDKNSADFARIRKKLNAWMKLDIGWYYFEMQYIDILPKIIAEKYMVDSREEGDLRDYKFLCFDGIPHYVWIDLDRSENHKRVVFDMNWERQSWTFNDLPVYDGTLEKPKCFEEMVRIASVLAKGFGHVRVDLYAINNHPYFGEMTFTSASGMCKFYPDEYDEKIGALWTLPNINPGSSLAFKSSS